MMFPDEAYVEMRGRIVRAVAALDAAGIPNVVAGENAAAAHIFAVDPAAVRGCPAMYLLIRRGDQPAAEAALAGIGYHRQGDAGGYLDLNDGRHRRAYTRLYFAGERVQPDDLLPAADVTESVPAADGPYRHLTLDALVRMELTLGRSLNRVMVRDLIDVGLIDATWPAKVPPELAARLQSILDTPDG